MQNTEIIKMLNACYKNEICINAKTMNDIIKSDKVKEVYKVNKNYVIRTYGKKYRNNKAIKENRENLELKVYKSTRITYAYLFAPTYLGFICIGKRIQLSLFKKEDIV